MINRNFNAQAWASAVLTLLLLAACGGGTKETPPRSAPADYTRFVVDSAIDRYEAEGRDATLAWYSSEENVDDQWYVFIIDKDDLVIAHPDPGRLELDMKGWVGTDANGYKFGPEMLSRGSR